MLLRRFFLLVPVLFVPAAAIAQAHGGFMEFVGSSVRRFDRFGGSTGSAVRRLGCFALAVGLGFSRA
jgi:hypothetical protein